MPNVNFPNDPYHEYKVEQIEKESQEKEKSAPPKEPHDYRLAILHVIWRNILKIFANAKKQTKFADPLCIDIEGLKALFRKLSQENVSKDLDFLNRLAFKWLEFIDSYNLLTPEEKDKLATLNQFVEEIYTYPKEAIYSLGYYLTEHAGYKWIPAPFMEILLSLHLEHQNNKDASHLAKWIRILEDVTRR